jgi:hypothetical protein
LQVNNYKHGGGGGDAADDYDDDSDNDKNDTSKAQVCVSCIFVNSHATAGLLKIQILWDVMSC